MTSDSNTDYQAELVDRFSDKYRYGQTELCQEIERNVFGCVYGATSWTTRDEADAPAPTPEYAEWQPFEPLPGGSWKIH